jgi:hypothetical protein
MIDEGDHDKVIRLEERLMASDAALDIARRDIERRLEGMNELRSQITRERSDYLTRTEYVSEHKILVHEIGSVQKFMWMVAGGLCVIEIALHYIK